MPTRIPLSHVVFAIATRRRLSKSKRFPEVIDKSLDKVPMVIGKVLPLDFLALERYRIKGQSSCLGRGPQPEFSLPLLRFVCVIASTIPLPSRDMPLVHCV